MRRTGPVLCLTAVLLAAGFSSSALAAANNDPDWPCIQRKVPELSLGQIWNGPDLPEAAKDWSNDADISERVEELAARRLPLPDAQKEIKEFAAALPPEKLQPQLTMLVQGLFDHMNAERSHVISGIARYAHKQLEMATALRKESSDVDALRNKPDADQNEVTRRTDQLTWQTRVFEERVQSLTYVCEVPTLIEQRLYQLAKTVAETLPKK